jgi:ecdysteroid 25-hydroxylase CYP306A1
MISDFVTYSLCVAGLICAEGELWKDQRKFITTSLKNFGMTKFGAKRERMDKRISVGVQECLEVRNAIIFILRRMTYE